MSKTEGSIKKYCGSIEERINACCDCKVADLLKTTICVELQQGSGDKAALNVLMKRIDELIENEFKN